MKAWSRKLTRRIVAGLNTETHGLFGAEEFALMKESAVITTVARGPIIDSDALAEALRSGAIGGAGLVRTLARKPHP